MDILSFVINLILSVWWFFAEHFWSDLETLWNKENRTKYWYIGWIIEAGLTYVAILVTKGFANQEWLGVPWLALVVSANIAALVCVIAFVGKQYKLVVFAGHWAWVVWTSSFIAFVGYIISLF